MAAAVDRDVAAIMPVIVINYPSPADMSCTSVATGAVRIVMIVVLSSGSRSGRDGTSGEGQTNGEQGDDWQKLHKAEESDGWEYSSV